MHRIHLVLSPRFSNFFQIHKVTLCSASPYEEIGKIRLEKKPNKALIFDPSNRPLASLDVSTKKHAESARFLGSGRLKVTQPPEQVKLAICHVIENVQRNVRHHVHEYMEAGVNLRNVLYGRKPPLNQRYHRWSRTEIEKLVRKRFEKEMERASGNLSEEIETEKAIQEAVEKRLKQLCDKWTPIDYNTTAGWAYLLGGKAAFDYASLRFILKEIKKRNPRHFKPKTLFDFGSGVGSVSWAVSEVFGPMNEVFCVDSSPDMVEFAQMILLKGDQPDNLPAGYTFRLHLPREHKLTFDLVTCAYSLLDLPTEPDRLLVVDNLWKKTAPDGFLILTEVGTNAGFQVLSEARHYLNQVCQKTRMAATDADEEEALKGHLFAPCPHEEECPRYNQDTIPCNFGVRYRNFDVPGVPKVQKDVVHEDLFSYLVFRKGERTSDCSWPRLVEQPMTRKNHVVCRMCTSRGKLEEVVAVKRRTSLEKDNRLLYNYAKSVSIGQQFRVHLSDSEKEDEV